MTDPVSTLLSAIEQEIENLPGAALTPAAAGARLDARLAEQMGRPVPPGVAAFFRRYDGGLLVATGAGSDQVRESSVVTSAAATDGNKRRDRDSGRAPAQGVRLLSFAESLIVITGVREIGKGDGIGTRGLWPLFQRGPHVVALDSEVPADREWPVVQVGDGSVDRLGTSLLRFLHVLCGELAAEAADPDEVEVARERCRRDPHLSEHWVDLAEALGRRRAPGDVEESERVVTEGARCADPIGPALLAAIGIAGLLAGETRRGRTALEDALECDPLTARDDDARLDAAAILLVVAADEKDIVLAERARSLLRTGTAATAGFWRAESVRALANEDAARATLALRVVEALVPDDTDVPRLRHGGPAATAASVALVQARAALDAGQPKPAAEHARTAIAILPELGVAHALLAEAANATHRRDAADGARAAIRHNPTLVDGWRELGDALLDAGDRAGAIAAFGQGLARDPESSLLHAKHAQALLEDGRRAEALEAISNADEPGSDGFYVAAVRGDILVALGRHGDAAEAYESALRHEPEDHWALHQAAIAHAESGDPDRAAQLYELALEHDHENCHQTLVDFAEVMKKLGRIGDAVRLYRRAVHAAPTETGWRQLLRQAEKELSGAPN